MLRTLKYLGVAAAMSLGQWLLTGAGAQYREPDAESKAATRKGLKNQNLDPEGEPAAFLKSTSPRFAAWRDRDGWHLRTTAGRGTHHFKGRIRVEGGSIAQVSSFRGERIAPAAHWKLQKNKQEVTFDFRSGERLDGVRFRVSPNALRVVFALQLDGLEQPSVVVIGQKNQHPEVLPVSLPAQPRQVKAGR